MAERLFSKEFYYLDSKKQQQSGMQQIVGQPPVIIPGTVPQQVIFV